MRVGLVCPYSWDVPGGVQFHVRDLAEALLDRGHEVSVLAPADEDTPLPAYVVPAGRAVPVPYNGSVARVNIGPLSAARVRRWLVDGDFDVLHLHEPATPSLSLLACWAASGPVVGTFHTSTLRSRAMTAAAPILYASLEKLSARIAVSEDARRTLVEHLGSDAVLVPNGIYVDRFATAAPRPAPGPGPTVCFLGRIDEPRKGLPTLLEAWPRIRSACPGARLLVAGSGDAEAAAATLPAAIQASVDFLGTVGDAEKAAMLAGADLFVAPHIGGESFGIVLAEAMAAGTAVLASDIDAFGRVLGGGRYGRLFPAGDADALGAAAVQLLGDPTARAELVEAASVEVRRYDWSVVVADVLAVYDLAGYDSAVTSPGAGPEPRASRLARWMR